MRKKTEKPNKRNYRPKQFKMVCRSCPKEVVCIEKFLKEVNRKLHFDDGTMYRVLVSCTEAVNNAILHGNSSDRKKKVEVGCSLVGNTFRICIRDEGKGFDPSGLADPREEPNLMKESGRGVFLMRTMMDKVTFKKVKNGFVVEMEMKLK